MGRSRGPSTIYAGAVAACLAVGVLWQWLTGDLWHWLAIVGGLATLLLVARALEGK